ncbi:MAG: TorF family putative porin [Pseudomonadales bacterium]|nr:TorF family putative porin [Pseudomonadales bacterium]
MKSLTKAIAVASLASVSTAAMAVEGLSTTIGFVSDYNYRGVSLGDAGANVSVDYSVGGFYAGVWAIDDGGAAAVDGLEYDTYLGWGGEVGGVEVGIGYTRYDYTYTSNYESEINLSAGIAGFGLAVALGNDDDGDAGDDDYTVIDLSYANGAFGVLLGQKSFDDADTEYKRFELSYSAEIGGADATATYGRVFDATRDSNDESSYGDDYLVLSLSKSFDL